MNTLPLALLIVPVLFTSVSLYAAIRRKRRAAVAFAAMAAGATLPLPALGWAARQAMLSQLPGPALDASALASFFAEAASLAHGPAAMGLVAAAATTLLFLVQGVLALRGPAPRWGAAVVALTIPLPLAALVASFLVATYERRVDEDVVSAFAAGPLECDDLADLLHAVPVARVEPIVADVRARARACVADELARVDSPEARQLATIRAELARTMGSKAVEASPLAQLASSPLLLDAGQRREIEGRLAHR